MEERDLSHSVAEDHEDSIQELVEFTNPVYQQSVVDLGVILILGVNTTYLHGK